MKNDNNAKSSKYFVNTTQDKDTTLDDLLEQMELLTNGSFYDYETQEEAKRLLTQWRDKQVEELLDRLEARLTEEASGIRQIKTDYAYGFTAANDQTNEAIEAERNKLKETPNED